MDDYTHLVGAAEIAERLNVSRTNVSVWRSRYADYPRPVYTLAMGQIFDFREIEAWCAANNLPARRDKKLSRDDIAVIRWRWTRDDTAKDLAEEYGVSEERILAVITNP